MNRHLHLMHTLPTRIFLIVSLLLAMPLYAQANDISSFLKGVFGDAQEQPQQQVQTSGEVAPTEMRRVPLSRAEMMLSFAPLVAEAGPAVVNVYATRMARQRVSPFADDPFFGQFFGRRNTPQRQQSSLGSGVIVESNGVVVTNHHVIAGADEIRVALADGREFKSRVLLQDEKLDLAVLVMETDATFPTILLDDSDSIAVGDLVLAIGNPFGVGQTTTSGIISATARNRVGVSDFGFFIQTDAAINPGNSGGALIGMNGRLIGINTAIFSRSGGSNGIGFAIPSNMVRAFLQQAKNGGEAFVPPWLGANFNEVTPDIAESVGLDRPFGALITLVIDNSPASKVGLKPGDVIIAINGSRIEHTDALGYRLATLSIGETVSLRIQRGFKAMDLSVKLAKRPKSLVGQAITIEGRSPFSGATVALKDGRQSRIQGSALRVERIKQGSPAARFGLRKGDFILVVNNVEVTSPELLQEIVSSDTRWWRFTLNRRGRILKQTLRF